jgi:hypothetical protein
MRKNLFKLLLTFLFLSVGHFIAIAQLNLYDFTQSNGTYTELTGATTLATATTTLTTEFMLWLAASGDGVMTISDSIE